MNYQNQQAKLDINDEKFINQIEQKIYKYLCVFQKYRIIKKIGQGAFGQVYKCSKDGKQYAMKIYDYRKIFIKYGTEGNILINYIHEQVKLIKQCKSIHIVKCYQTYQNNLYKILILQYCSNQNLTQFLLRKGGSLQESIAISILQQICLGVVVFICMIQELHRRKIIHRDLKLDNIMVCNGICKIIDLGFSRKLATDPRSGVLQTDVGTFDFKAPEIINRQKYGLKADIYSIGIIYMILISNCEFDRRHRYNFYNNRKLLFIDKKISQNSIDFLQQTLKVDKLQRISWEQLLKHKIFQNIKMPQKSQILDVNQKFIQLTESIRSIQNSQILIESSVIDEYNPSKILIDEKQQQNPRYIDISFEKKINKYYLF